MQPVFAQVYGTWKSLTSLQKATSIAAEKQSGQAIWVGTTGGVYRFETGTQSLQTFTNTDGLLGIDVSAVMYDSLRNALWIGFSDGKINFYDLSSSRISNYYELSRISQFSSNAIRNFYLHGDSIFVGTDFGVALFQVSRDEFRDTFFQLGAFDEGLCAQSTTVLENMLVVATEAGLAMGDLTLSNLVSPSSWENISASVSGEVYAVCHFNNAVYVGAENGLFILDGTQLVSHSSISGKKVLRLDATQTALFALAEDELVEISTESETHVEGDFSTAVSLAACQDGRVFLADTLSSLLEVVNGEILTHEINSPCSNVFAVLGFDAEGRLWGSSSYNSTSAVGFYAFDGTTWTNYANVLADGASDTIFQFCDIQARGSATYFGTWGGGLLKLTDDSLHVFHNGNSDLVGTSSENDFIIIPSLAKDENDLIWMTNYLTKTNPIHALTEDDVFKKYGSSSQSATSFPSSYVAEHILIDKEGKKWISCVSKNGDALGLYIFDDHETSDDLSDDAWSFLDDETGSGALPSLKINGMSLDQNGIVWIATDNGGAYFFDSENIDDAISISELDGENLTAIAVDELNRKWFGSENGVWVLDDNATEIEAHYTAENSELLSNQVYAIAIEDASGKVYIGTDQGLSVFHSVAVSPKQSLTTLKIYPNPYRVPSSGSLVVEGLTRNASLKILTISGKLVRHISGYGGSVIEWDGCDSQGKTVASGIYIAVGISESGEDTAVGKIAVIRRK
nr:hypothetical protein [Chloroherpeton thalassium]